MRSGLGNPDHARRLKGGLQGQILGGPVEKVLHTFSMMKVFRPIYWPFLYDDVIESPFLGYSALFNAAHEFRILLVLKL